MAAESALTDASVGEGVFVECRVGDAHLQSKYPVTAVSGVVCHVAEKYVLFTGGRGSSAYALSRDDGEWRLGVLKWGKGGVLRYSSEHYGEVLSVSFGEPPNW